MQSAGELGRGGNGLTCPLSLHSCDSHCCYSSIGSGCCCLGMDWLHTSCSSNVVQAPWRSSLVPCSLPFSAHRCFRAVLAWLLCQCRLFLSWQRFFWFAEGTVLVSSSMAPRAAVLFNPPPQVYYAIACWGLAVQTCTRPGQLGAVPMQLSSPGPNWTGAWLFQPMAWKSCQLLDYETSCQTAVESWS